MGIWLARWLIYPAFQKQRDPDRGSSALKAVVAGLSMILIAGPWMSSRGLIRIRGEIVRSAHDPLWYYAAAAFTGPRRDSRRPREMVGTHPGELPHSRGSRRDRGKGRRARLDRRERTGRFVQRDLLERILDP